MDDDQNGEDDSEVENEEEAREDADQESDEQAVEEIEEEEEEEGEDIDEEAAAQAKVQEYLARQAELALIREEVEKVKAAGDWHPDEIFLFERISMRSYEEVISSDWRIDLPTLPEVLFTKEPEKIFVKNNCNSSYSGVKALQRLLALGYRVRDLRCNAHPQFERLITRELKSYIRWAEYDGDYVKRRFIPVLSLVSAKRGQSTDSLSNSITKEMMFLASKHRENLALPSGRNGIAVKYRRQPPLLYGIIVARSIVIFVTLDSANPEAKVRHLTHFDFTDYRMVVWNGFAIAYIITMAKDYIISIRDDLEIDDTPYEDPDA
ncbi:hypothetical protein N431DRAFT_341630 [Stipitochalara longipes BDJ]|nr:hypothetical protein N431DRAFT_341630 [Stipitochalara longipes BDJ]